MWSCYRAPDESVRKNLSAEEIAEVLRAGTGTLWVDMPRSSQEDVKLLESVFHFHPLAIEDSLNPQSRVKMEEYRDFLILIVRGVEFCEDTEDPYDIETANLACFLGKNYVVTVRSDHAPAVDAIVKVLERKPELLDFGPARVMHAVVDESVNAYFPILDRLDEFMDSLEEQIFTRFDQETLREIFRVKRLVVSLRRHLAPQRDAFTILTNRPSPLLAPDTQVYFRDIYDHVLRINDSLETYRELLSNTLDSYLSQISNRLGSVTKALSVVATVSLPFVVVSGMWGMNFHSIPLSGNPSGFWLMLVLQIVMGVLLLAFLRWRKFL